MLREIGVCVLIVVLLVTTAYGIGGLIGFTVLGFKAIVP